MAKSKEFERQYKEEGKRRMLERKNDRNAKYKHLSRRANEYGCPIAGAKGESWADPNSPTGYSQICSWQGICQ